MINEDDPGTSFDFDSKRNLVEKSGAAVTRFHVLGNALFCVLCIDRISIDQFECRSATILLEYRQSSFARG